MDLSFGGGISVICAKSDSKVNMNYTYFWTSFTKHTLRISFIDFQEGGG